MSKPVIGFVGLGLMGGNMVECLQTKGYRLVILDRNQQTTEAVVGRSGAVAASPTELAAASDIVMLCVTTSAMVEGLF